MAKAYLMRRGGGSGGGVELSLIAAADETALPADPALYTIGILTETPIANWQVGGPEPADPQQGDVWFAVADSGRTRFDLLEENGLYLSPALARQYENGAWTAKRSGIYDGVSWAGLLLYLYHDGDVCEPLSGGWGVSYIGSGSDVSGANTTTGYLLTYCLDDEDESYGYGGISTVNKIDFTPYRTLTVRITNTTTVTAGNISAGYLICGLQSTRGSWNFESWQWSNPAVIQRNASVTATIDVSGVTGSYYLTIRGRTSGETKKLLLTECTVE